MKGSNSIVLDTIRNEFLEVYGIIQAHRNKIIAAVDNESLLMIWEVGGYVSVKLKCSSWGDGVVRQLAEFIHAQDPTSRRWSYRTIYPMVQLYETYSNDSFKNLLKQTKMIRSDKIVPFLLAQFSKVQFLFGWWQNIFFHNGEKMNLTLERKLYLCKMIQVDSLSRFDLEI